MEDIAPKWVIWVSFVIFCITGVSIIFYAFFSLKDLSVDPSYVLGNLVGQALIFYFLIYVPARIMYENYLRKNSK